ncbi:undecaprenyl-diphosphatase [Gemmobacter megaterium]|uniref:Undecaprenyl-diphosphatase n=1 Tax=Gemmobacter megaterium TaxID=1086013 RepID=A0A1N7LM33_9RHOB|nr:undecaprenyl-diphosphate phosphatase [Gemmobacter megaterium]GGE11832.1 undecaprenyl-diphosphatase [Gemmobacter megaterium]SIS74839.1 undecaprenyl-diphosphatase [Gemmobacter megaterium]
MPLLTLCLLAIVQGLTEFLPVSSSAHLILLHEWSGQTADALALDVAVHVGSVLAVILYLRAEVGRVMRGLGQAVRGQTEGADARLALYLVLATIPTLIVGVILAATGLIDRLRDPVIIGITMIVFGLWLWWAHRTAPEERGVEDWRLRDVVRMGLWQAVALIPGVSRSGITMTTARLLRFERHAAARLSLLMSIPVTLATGGYLGIKVVKEGMTAAQWTQIGFAALLALISAWVALVLMMRFLNRVSFTPYVIYRVVLGIVLLAVVL